MELFEISPSLDESTPKHYANSLKSIRDPRMQACPPSLVTGSLESSLFADDDLVSCPCPNISKLLVFVLYPDLLV